MKKLALAAVLLVALGAGAGTIFLDQQQQEALTTIDTVPSKTLYDSLPNPLTQTELEGVAGDGSASPAFRLRAIHALSTYCAASPCGSDDPAHVTLANLLVANGSAASGADLLILRGAVEAIGPMRVATDAGVLVTMLNHPSRDIRSTAALALGALCNSNSTTIAALHERYSNESTDQVKLAISAALRMLPCPVN